MKCFYEHCTENLLECSLVKFNKTRLNCVEKNVAYEEKYLNKKKHFDSLLDLKFCTIKSRNIFIKTNKCEQNFREKGKYNSLSNISNDYLIDSNNIKDRSLLGLCSIFSDCIYNIFNSDTYNIKYIETISSEIDSYISYIISEENNLSFSFFYHIPLKNSISNYELLALIRQAYTYHIMETIQNLYKFLSISKISIYMKVPYYTLTIFNNILNNIECSLIYMQGRICGINHIDKIVEEKFKKENDDKEKDGEELFFKAALMLAQSAYQDSLQVIRNI